MSEVPLYSPQKGMRGVGRAPGVVRCGGGVYSVRFMVDGFECVVYGLWFYRVCGYGVCDLWLMVLCGLWSMVLECAVGG